MARTTVRTGEDSGSHGGLGGSQIKGSTAASRRRGKAIAKRQAQQSESYGAPF